MASQTVFSYGTGASQKVWLDSSVFPLYAYAASVLSLLIQLAVDRGPRKDSAARGAVPYTVARVVGNFGLLGLSIVTHARHGASHWYAFAWIVTFAYAALLATASAVPATRSRLVSTHTVLVNLAVLLVLLYRNVWPLATFALQPLDRREGSLMWAKVALSTLVSVIIPLAMPRKHQHVNPEKPLEPTEEQTASPFSFFTFSFLDRVIFLAQSKPHLDPEDLPVIADTDTADYLRAQAWPTLDPTLASNDKNILFGLLYVFRAEYTLAAVLLAFQAMSELANPLAIKNLLEYVQARGDGEFVVKPWLWVLLLFIAPLATSVSTQWFQFLTTRVLVQAETIITQLIFEHSLRIRIKSEGGSDKDEDKHPSNANLLGKLDNLITTDLANVTGAREFLAVFVYMPLQLGGSIYFLWKLLGWSAFVGLGTMIVLIPVPGYIGAAFRNVQKATMKKTDARVQAVSQMLGVLRMVKLFGWERSMASKLGNVREEELRAVRHRQVLRTFNVIVNFFISILYMLATLWSYTMIQKGELTAARLFASITIFDMIRGVLFRFMDLYTQIIAGKVSLDRVTEFLHQTELLDAHTEEFVTPASLGDKIGFVDAQFSWSKDSEDDRAFTLTIEGELFFKQNDINLVIGSTGSGKTALLLSLLGELHFISPGPKSAYNLPRQGGVAYASQESWVQSVTVRENIVFGLPYDEARYKKVLYQCALERDLELFVAGDLTEVGEKGLTLSGGQKARVTLARAIYSQAEIVLLDDVLAALDVHTARWIVDKCLLGDLVKGRTVIMVTHNLAMTQNIAGFVVALGPGGTILSQGSLSDAIEQDSTLANELSKEKEELLKEDEPAETTEDKPDETETTIKGKLVVAEEIKTGRIDTGALRLLVSALGGRFPVLFWFLVLTGMIVSDIMSLVAIRWLGYWSEQYELGPPSSVPANYYVGMYSLFLLLDMSFITLYVLVFLVGQIHTSRTIHERLLASVLGSPFRWLDITPTSRIIARFTQDIGALDSTITLQFRQVLMIALALVLRLGAITLVTPVALPLGALLLVVGWIMGRIYMKAQIAVKRELSNAKAPVLAEFGSGITGLASIRAYGAEATVTKKLRIKLDHATRISRTFNNLGRWIAFRIDILGAGFCSALAGFLVYGRSASSSAAEIGFTLSQTVSFGSYILLVVRIYNEFEIGVNSIERIQSYLKIEQEPKPTEAGRPPAYWPASGSIRVENLSARYSEDGPLVLKNLNFTIKSGERVGVVGRTGSGKSTLTLALLRGLLIDSGAFFYDGIDVASLNLESLRENITIIPQAPELLAGTLRENLDPFTLHTDAELNDALRSAGLFSLQDDTIENKITLDSSVSGGGSNMSVGQKQILALARALLRKSKILVLDEATAQIDYKTDAVIQKSLREELPKDVTLITVAHRLQTIMNADKIIVLDAGQLAEFDSPKTLLARPTSLFSALVNESGDKEALYEMVQ